MLALLALLALTPQQDTEVRVVGPGRPNGQTPATLVVEPAAMFIVACDADGDGRTSRAELDACVARSFTGIDAGRTGALGYIAYADWQRRWLGDQGALPSPFEVDRDGDDRVTLAELQAQFSKLFSRYDKDHDSAVTRAEALTIRAVAADAKGPVGGRGRDRDKKDARPRERVPRGKPPPRPPVEQP